MSRPCIASRSFGTGIADSETCRTSYSLAGHVVLTLPTLPDALKGRLREIVQLELLLEGKSEFFDEEGESAARSETSLRLL